MGQGKEGRSFRSADRLSWQSDKKRLWASFLIEGRGEEGRKEGRRPSSSNLPISQFLLSCPPDEGGTARQTYTVDRSVHSEGAAAGLVYLSAGGEEGREEAARASAKWEVHNPGKSVASFLKRRIGSQGRRLR